MNTRIFADNGVGPGGPADTKVGLRMPFTDAGKAIASRNATTHGLFARDVVLPSLGEDPAGYHQLQTEWTAQIQPRNLLEQHYTEKIAAASWRLRRLQRWQAQLFEDATLTEEERINRLDKVMRHETALQRQIDTAVKMLGRDVRELYQRRLRDQVLEDLHVTERECRDEPETDLSVSLETSNRLYRLRKSTALAASELSTAPLDTTDAAAVLPAAETCEIEPAAPDVNPDAALDAEAAELVRLENCQIELSQIAQHPSRVREYLDPDYKYRPPTYHGPPGKRRAVRPR